MGDGHAPRVLIARALRAGADAIVAAVHAPRCAGCAGVLEHPLDGPVCAACWEAAARGGGFYEGALRHILHAFKYEGRRSLSGPLAALMRAAHPAALEGADGVVPVPLHPWRRLRRGFNQAADLAGALGPPVVHALWRVRHTAAQTELSAVDRARNVRGAFRLSPWLRPDALRDRVVVLVDDVRTTGATLEACAAVLRRAGAREVRMVTAAHAELARTPAHARDRRSLDQV